MECQAIFRSERTASRIGGGGGLLSRSEESGQLQHRHNGQPSNQALTDAKQFAEFDADRKAALGALGQAILAITTSGYQAKHLREEVVKTDPHLQVVLAALQESVTGDGTYLLCSRREKQASRSIKGVPA